MSNPVATKQTEPVRGAGVFYPLVPWMLMAVLAVANDVLRETVLAPQIGGYAAHLLSASLLVVAIVVIAYGYFVATPFSYTTVQLVLVGATWAVLATAFEFLVGYVSDVPLATTLERYDLLAGHVWLVVPLTLLVAPLLVVRYRN